MAMIGKGFELALCFICTRPRIWLRRRRERERRASVRAAAPAESTPTGDVQQPAGQAGLGKDQEQHHSDRQAA